jgi:SagB-type dehydrogenase family enzyme
MLPLDDPTALSLLFHLNSEPWLNDEAYESAGRQELVREADATRHTIPLEPPDDTELTALWRRRRSCRAFAPRQLQLSAVSALAAAAQGVVEVARTADGQVLVRRAAPSAGGLYPLDVYVFASRVDGLPDGLYEYRPLAHSLQERALGDVDGWLAGATYVQPFVQGANVVLALVATFARTQKKYGPRGYRYILLEAGHAVQNVCLRAAELDLATLCIGGFVDSLVNERIGLSPTEAGVVYMVAAGHDARGS